MTNSPILVFLSTPYSNGDTEQSQRRLEENVQLAEDVAIQLIDAGFLVYVPVQSHYIHMRHPRVYEKWLDMCKCWIERCDVLLRPFPEIPNVGSNIEEAWAARSKVAVYHSFEKLIADKQKLEAERAEWLEAFDEVYNTITEDANQCTWDPAITCPHVAGDVFACDGCALLNPERRGGK